MQEGRIAVDVIGNAVEVMPIAKGEETDGSVRQVLQRQSWIGWVMRLCGGGFSCAP
jgi:hypothetical protein